MHYKVKENWLTRAPHSLAMPMTWFMAFLIYFTSLMFFKNILNAQEWMPAIPAAVFNQHQYWRAWTALFAHADPRHLINNLLLFIPLTYWLVGYFGVLFFPIMAFVMGGVVNLMVLKTMPMQASLIGVSGVVYWMGSAWITLFLLIDRRHEFKRRFATAMFLFLMLLVPETYTPEVSYMSHLIGFLAGIPSALALYFIHRKRFESAEVKEIVIENPEYTSDEKIFEIS